MKPFERVTHGACTIHAKQMGGGSSLSSAVRPHSLAALLGKGPLTTSEERKKVIVPSQGVSIPSLTPEPAAAEHGQRFRSPVRPRAGARSASPPAINNSLVASLPDAPDAGATQGTDAAVPLVLRQSPSSGIDGRNSPERGTQLASSVSLTMFAPSADGVLVRECCTEAEDLRLAVKEAEESFPKVEALATQVRIPPGATTPVSVQVAKAIDSVCLPGALSFVVTHYDDQFFPEVSPQLSSEGVLTIDPATLTGRHGTTRLLYRAVDHSAVLSVEPLEFKQSREHYVDVEIVALPTAAKRIRDWKSHQNRLAVDVSPMRGRDFSTTEADSGASVDTDVRRIASLIPVNIHIFRQTPPRVTPSILAFKFCQTMPLMFLRFCNYSAEREHLSSVVSTVSHEDLAGILEEIKSVMKQRAPLAAVIPLLDKACAAHFHVGGVGNVATAQKLAQLRITIVSGALGLDTASDKQLDMPVALRLASVKGSNVRTLIRVLVEGAHLFKATGMLKEALKCYRLATSLASVVSEQEEGRGGTRTATGQSMVPFLVATGDVLLMIGDVSEALDCYERARAFADSNGVQTLVAECEDLVGLANAILGHDDECRIAQERSLKIREKLVDSVLPVSESLLFQAVCSALRNRHQQALLTAVKVIDALTAYSTKVASAQQLLGAAHMVAGWMSLPLPGSDEATRHFHAAAALNVKISGEHSLEACFPMWLGECASQASTAAETHARCATLCEMMAHYITGAHPLPAMVALCAAVTAGDSPAAVAQGFLDSSAPMLVAALEPTHQLFAVTFEAVALIHVQLRRHRDAVAAVDRFVWSYRNCVPSMTLDDAAAFRCSTLIAEAYALAQVLPAPDLDEFLAAIIGSQRKRLGEHDERLVPLLTDAAEIRYCRGHHREALEIFGLALRIADHRNLLYLLGPLLKPATKLTTAEVADRDRLARERGADSHLTLRIALLLFQIGRVHEGAEDPTQASEAYQQCIAAFEMGDLVGHPAATAALTSLGRVLLSIGELGDALRSLLSATDIVQKYHYQCGQYRSNETVRLVLDDAQRTLHAIQSLMWHNSYTLIPHDCSSLDPNLAILL